MFDSTLRARIASRTAATLYAALDDWRAGDGGWFDNSIASVDARIARADALIHRFRCASTSADSGDIIAGLTSERSDLAAFRESMLNAHQDREHVAAYAAPADQRHLVEARAFVRENLDAATAPSEILTRAARYAEQRRLDAGFINTVAAVARQVPVPRTAAVFPATVADFPDHLLFS